MDFNFLILLCIIVLFFFAGTLRGLVASHLTVRKRLQLINRWAASGDFDLAREEFDRVTYSQHNRAVFLFKNPMKLYGPLIQGVWDDDTPKNYDKYWWRCYNEIYLNMMPASQAAINKELAKYTKYTWPVLPHALLQLNVDIGSWLGSYDHAEQKFSMADGVEEYEQAMAAQNLMQL